LVNRIAAVLATLGAGDYNPLLQSRRRRLNELRTGLGEPLPPHARAKIERLLARLELVLAHITELERERDAVAETAAPDHAARMIQQLAGLRGIGVQSATVLVREAFVRRFANGKALGSYAGLTATPYSSGGLEREQGIGKAGNRRLRSVMVELAWALATLPARRGAGSLVPRTRRQDRKAPSQGYGRGARTQAPDRALAVRNRRCRARGRCYEACDLAVSRTPGSTAA